MAGQEGAGLLLRWPAGEADAGTVQSVDSGLVAVAAALVVLATASVIVVLATHRRRSSSPIPIHHLDSDSFDGALDKLTQEQVGATNTELVRDPRSGKIHYRRKLTRTGEPGRPVERRKVVRAGEVALVTDGVWQSPAKWSKLAREGNVEELAAEAGKQQGPRAAGLWLVAAAAAWRRKEEDLSVEYASRSLEQGELTEHVFPRAEASMRATFHLENLGLTLTLTRPHECRVALSRQAAGEDMGEAVRLVCAWQGAESSIRVDERGGKLTAARHALAARRLLDLGDVEGCLSHVRAGLECESATEATVSELRTSQTLAELTKEDH